MTNQETQTKRETKASDQPIVPRLFSVTDHDGTCDWDDAWWMLVWANSADEALRFARENYSGGYSDDDEFDLVVASEHLHEILPVGAVPQEEHRETMMRECGWMEDPFDRKCECCDRASLGYSEWRVCSECFLCAECRDENGIACECRDED